MSFFLCSDFTKTGSLLKENVSGKTVLFIPTASITESYTGYVDSAKILCQKMGSIILELDISRATTIEIDQAFAKADIVYVPGGNTFFLIDQIRKKGVDKRIDKHIKSGKWYVVESAGAIICAEELFYIRPMDAVPSDFSLDDYAGLGLIDCYIIQHYLFFPFEESSKVIVGTYSSLNLYPLRNEEAVLFEQGKIKKLSSH